MEFVQVEHSEELLPILESRLPKSAHSYNMVLMSPKFKDEMRIYVLNGEISDQSCIVTVNYREDYKQEINISVPKNFEVTEKLKNLFATSSIFNWDNIYIISGIERSLTPMLLEISAFVKGNAIGINPCTLYYMDREEAANLEIKEIPNVTVKSMDNVEGIEFLHRTWKYKLQGSDKYISRAVNRNPSTGVYIDGKVVSGILLNACGLIGMLNTEPEHRQKGYAKLCFHSIMKKCAENGLVPCSSVEIKNSVSARFHESIGMKASHTIYFVIYTNSGF